MHYYLTLICLFTALAVLLLPFVFVLAALELELEVEFPGFGGEALTAESTLAQTIKYVARISLIIIGIAIFIALIYGGFVYLTSAGNPAKMAAGRKRLVGSILGLAIVLISYLLLQLINPDFLILQIEKVPVNTGILLLNDVAYNAATNSGNQIYNGLRSYDLATVKQTAEDLIKGIDIGGQEAKAVFLAWRVPDLREYFGPFDADEILAIPSLIIDPRRSLTPSSGSGNVFNFEDFKLKGLFFLPNTNVKVLEFYNPDFKNCLEDEGPDNEYAYPHCSALEGPCIFKLLDSTLANEKRSSAFEQAGLNVPPPFLSAPLGLAVEYLGRGVFLEGARFGQILPISDLNRLIPRLEMYDFNDKTKKITIKNWELEHILDPATMTSKLRANKLNNYLAVLYDDAWFRGQFRFFFEQFFDEDVANVWRGNVLTVDAYRANYETENVKIDNVGGLATVFSLEVKDESDAYGRVNGASSARVFEMPVNDAEKEAWALSGGCRVLFCAQEAQGINLSQFQKCFAIEVSDLSSPTGPQARDPEDNSLITEIEATLYFPFNIPDQDIEIGTEQINFHDNIKAVRIQGNCLVALFENKVNDFSDCLACDINNPNTKSRCDNCWAHSTPGNKSEVLGPGDGEWPYYPALLKEEHPSGDCGKFLIRKFGSCASSIAIFPIIR